ncbi:MAG TPA: hypothetical protein VK797_06865 [Tepidisphaeraceae bacterium]|nr:hypothetical protein [Tepidisphaeraceae bacterium]
MRPYSGGIVFRVTPLGYGPEFSVFGSPSRFQESRTGGLLRTSEQAVAAVARAAAEGDARIALTMLREMGLLRAAGRCAEAGDQPIE